MGVDPRREGVDMSSLWTTWQASVHLGLTDRRVRQLCAAGKIPGARRIGRDWVIPDDAVREYADEMPCRMPVKKYHDS